jgi:UDP-N-acetyl-D-glucosamine dehydrogenase
MALMELLDRLNRREATIGILGLGYVGLPLMLRFADAGYRVSGFDVDAVKVQALNAGRSYIEHITAEAITQALRQGFHATTDFSRAAACDALIADPLRANAVESAPRA